MHKMTPASKSLHLQVHFHEMSFPAITFCNLNPYKRSLLEAASPEIKAMVSNLFICTSNPENTSTFYQMNVIGQVQDNSNVTENKIRKKRQLISNLQLGNN